MIEDYGALMLSTAAGTRGAGRSVSGLVAPAHAAARDLLGGLGDGGRRWRHTRAVATRAARAASLLGPREADVLIAAAWLHDTGYAPPLVRHGFHPVDGAEFVLQGLADPLLAGLIAHHSGARFVADVRGLSDLLETFARPIYWTGTVADALTWADQTTDPDGAPVSVEARLAETLARHGIDSPNGQAHPRRAPAVVAAVRARKHGCASDEAPEEPSVEATAPMRWLDGPQFARSPPDWPQHCGRDATSRSSERSMPFRQKNSAF